MQVTQQLRVRFNRISSARLPLIPCSTACSSHHAHATCWTSALRIKRVAQVLATTLPKACCRLCLLSYVWLLPCTAACGSLEDLLQQQGPFSEQQAATVLSQVRTEARS
jgi:hypothetical protein